MVEQDGKRFAIVTAPLPLLLIRRGLLAPSMLAHVIVQRFRFGMPFFRQEEQLEADGIELNRGTMARSTEDIGACLGAIVLACVDDARKHAFCLSTDATGVAIHPEPLPDGRRQACRKGHFFVVLADKKHVFFEFQPKHTSAAVCEMFRGFSGYVQADAHAVYDTLFRGDAVEHWRRAARRGGLLGARSQTSLGSRCLRLRCRTRGTPARAQAVRPRPGVEQAASIGSPPETENRARAVR